VISPSQGIKIDGEITNEIAFNICFSLNHQQRSEIAIFYWYDEAFVDNNETFS